MFNVKNIHNKSALCSVLVTFLMFFQIFSGLTGTAVFAKEAKQFDQKVYVGDDTYVGTDSEEHKDELYLRVVAENGVFPEGSKLQASKVEEASQDYSFSFSLIDDKGDVEFADIYNIKVLSPDNKEIKNFSKAKIYFPIRKSMDYQDLKALFVNEGKDENFSGAIESIDGKDYYVIETNHFSNYALMDKLNSQEFTTIFITIGVAALIVTALIIFAFVSAKKNRSNNQEN